MKLIAPGLRQEEVAEYKAGKGLRKRPDINAEMKKVEDAVKRKTAAPPEPDESDLVANSGTPASPGPGRPFVFTKSLLDDIAAKVLKLKGSPGFGIRTVRTVASAVFQSNAQTLVPGHLDAVSWRPSDRWCNYFLKNHMNFRYRRITGKQVLCICF